MDEREDHSASHCDNHSDERAGKLTVATPGHVQDRENRSVWAHHWAVAVAEATSAIEDTAPKCGEPSGGAERATPVERSATRR